MEVVAAAGLTALGTVVAAYFASASDRKKVRQIHDSLGQANGQGPVTKMNERQLAQLTRMEGSLTEILHWQGRHEAAHTVTSLTASSQLTESLSELSEGSP